jgi:hypothetical protein
MGMGENSKMGSIPLHLSFIESGRQTRSAGNSLSSKMNCN